MVFIDSVYVLEAAFHSIVPEDCPYASPKQNNIYEGAVSSIYILISFDNQRIIYFYMRIF